jgi:amino acid transporter
MSVTDIVPAAARLRRSLGLWHLVLYGVIVIQPTAPMPLFGLLDVQGRSCVVTTVLVAMLSMLFTRVSYGRIARIYPSAGSAFMYVGQDFGSGMAAHRGAARLLYGMGRSNALPSSFFGAIEPRKQIPRNNVLLIGAIALADGFVLDYNLGAQMLNFGALTAFMGVNLAALMRYYVRSREKKIVELIPRSLGFLICLVLRLNLSYIALILGAVWMLNGIAFGAWRTRWFRRELVNFDFAEEI